MAKGDIDLPNESGIRDPRLPPPSDEDWHDPNDPAQMTELDRQYAIKRDWEERDSPEAQKKSQAQTTPQGTNRGTASKGDGRQVRKIKIAPTNNGGYVVTHHYAPANGHGTPSTDTYAFDNYDDVHDHLSGLKH